MIDKPLTLSYFDNLKIFHFSLRQTKNCESVIPLRYLVVPTRADNSHFVVAAQLARAWLSKQAIAMPTTYENLAQATAQCPIKDCLHYTAICESKSWLSINVDWHHEQIVRLYIAWYWWVSSQQEIVHTHRCTIYIL